jgi:hypothetical protein
VYRAGESVVHESKKRKDRRQYGGAIAQGFLRGLPSGALVGGTIGGARRMYDNSVAATKYVKDMADRHSKEVGDLVGTTADAIRKSERHLADLKEQIDRVARPVGDSMEAMKAEAKGRKPGFFSRMLRRKAGDVLLKGENHAKQAGVMESAGRGAARGAAIAAVYGGLLHGLTSKGEAEGRSVIKDALTGALIYAPKGAVLGAGLGAGSRLYREHRASEYLKQRSDRADPARVSLRRRLAKFLS